jgi:transcriptional regulator with XRE-family HTH domain
MPTDTDPGADSRLMMTDAASPPTIGEQIRARRQALGLNQRDCSYLAKVSLGHQSILENGYVPRRGSRALERILATLDKLEREAR